MNTGKVTNNKADKIRRTLALAICCGLGVALANMAMAQTNEDTQEVQGVDIQGTESLQLDIALVPTTNAPPGASGQASLGVDDQNGTNTTVLTVESLGLTPGTYTVSVTRKSDGSTIVLGSYAATASNQTNSADMDNVDVQQTGGGPDSTTGDNGLDQQGEAGGLDFGNNGGLPLPAGLSPLDIATVSVADAGGVVVLTGDFTNVSQIPNGDFQASVAVVGGPLAPGAAGQTSMSTVIKKGKAKTAFSLNAHGVPANQRLALQINHRTVGALRSDKHGNVRLTKLPRRVNPLTIVSVSAVDAQGRMVLKSKF